MRPVMTQCRYVFEYSLIISILFLGIFDQLSWPICSPLVQNCRITIVQSYWSLGAKLQVTIILFPRTLLMARNLRAQIVSRIQVYDQQTLEMELLVSNRYCKKGQQNNVANKKVSWFYASVNVTYFVMYVIII